MNGSIAAYAEQILISTGRSDWASRIEEDKDASLVGELKRQLGPGGKFNDPYHSALVTNSSLPPSAIDKATASAFLLPTFEYIPSIPIDSKGVEAFIKAFVLPAQLHAAHEDTTTREQRNVLQRQPESRSNFPGLRKVDEILVLICGHGKRDERCGILGPLLQAEFEEKLVRQNVAILRDAPVVEAVDAAPVAQGYIPTARVGLISHIGGHKFAGNVIIYIPPNFTSNALHGKGIWYGRVEPQHVEGIVSQTIMGGKVIEDHFRGGIDQGGEMMRL